MLGTGLAQTGRSTICPASLDSERKILLRTQGPAPPGIPTDRLRRVRHAGSLATSTSSPLRPQATRELYRHGRGGFLGPLVLHGPGLPTYLPWRRPRC